ncbi:MAG: hypothetical protein H6937_09250 [Burkholderiales bacterium]|nr:hypothetical protein [Burkholderiales bacterium]
MYLRARHDILFDSLAAGKRYLPEVDVAADESVAGLIGVNKAIDYHPG